VTLLPIADWSHPLIHAASLADDLMPLSSFSSSSASIRHNMPLVWRRVTAAACSADRRVVAGWWLHVYRSASRTQLSRPSCDRYTAVGLTIHSPLSFRLCPFSLRRGSLLGFDAEQCMSLQLCLFQLKIVGHFLVLLAILPSCKYQRLSDIITRIS